MKSLPLLKYRILGGERNRIREHLARELLAGVRSDPYQTAEVVLYHLRHRRGIHLRGALQHLVAVQISGSRHEELKRLDVPALVVHGTADRFLPCDHGRKLAASIPSAVGLWLEGTGHAFPYPDMPRVEQALREHLAGSLRPSEAG